MDMQTFYQHADADTGLVSTLRGLDQALCASYVSALSALFKQIIAQEHRDKQQFEALKQAYAATARGAMSYLDDSGVTAAVGRVAPLLRDVSFKQNEAMLAYEAACLFRLGIPHDKIRPYWEWLDHHKAPVLTALAQPGFLIAPTIDAAVLGFGHEVGGAAWEHLSPGWWRRLAGAALIVANCVAEIPTAGLATASVVVGVVGIAAK